MKYFIFLKSISVWFKKLSYMNKDLRTTSS